MKSLKYTAVLVLVAGLAGASIITPTSVTDTGTFDATGDAGSALGALIDASGLSGTPVDDGSTAGGVTHVGGSGDIDKKWVTTDPGAAYGDFFVDKSGTVQLDFALGSQYEITTAYIWGYYYWGNANSATAIDVSYSNDGSNFSGTESISLSIPPDNNDPISVSTVTLNNALSDTTHVRFLFTDNGYGQGTGGDRLGLGEVAFGTIPEPFSIGLMACFGGLVLLMRRRLHS